VLSRNLYLSGRLETGSGRTLDRPEWKRCPAELQAGDALRGATPGVEVALVA
jgi:hypothetical protein